MYLNFFYLYNIGRKYKLNFYKQDYNLFYSNFIITLKEGLYHNRKKIFKLVSIFISSLFFYILYSPFPYIEIKHEK